MLCLETWHLEKILDVFFDNPRSLAPIPKHSWSPNRCKWSCIPTYNDRIGAHHVESIFQNCGITSSLFCFFFWGGDLGVNLANLANLVHQLQLLQEKTQISPKTKVLSH